MIKTDIIMKRIFTFIAIAIVSLSVAEAHDRPVTLKQLPAAAQSFISMNYPDEKISYSTVDDDIIRPDYTVMFVNGTKVQFNNDGSLEKIESRAGVPVNLVPVQIADYVKLHYPDAVITGYEVGKRTYDVELSNRLELKFNRNFNLIEIDD